MKFKFWLLITIVFMITSCTNAAPKEEIEKASLTGDFILAYHAKKDNSYLVGRNIKVSKAELDDLITKTPNELLMDTNLNLIWLNVSDRSTSDASDAPPALGSQIKIIESSDAQQDTLPPTVYATEIEVVK